MKKLIAAIMFTLMLALSSTTAVGTVTIRWAEWWDPEWGEDTIKWIIDTFEANHPDD